MKRSRARNRAQCGEGWAMIGSEPTVSVPSAPTDQQVTPLARLRLEKRRGKPVTVAAMEGVGTAALRALSQELKVVCGTGGTLKGESMELQGDHRDPLRAALRDRGFQVKG